MTTFDFRGFDAQYRGSGGRRTANSAASLAKALYDEGWQHADITDGGRLVGAVTRDLNGKRTWWGDKAGHAPPEPTPDRRRARSRHPTPAG